MRIITNELIQKFKTYLIGEEKSSSTLEKYIRDITVFMEWCKKTELNKSVVLEYKQNIVEKYAPTSVNSILSSLNSFFAYNEWYDLKVKALKIQRQIFASKDKEMTKAEYERLLVAAKQKKNQRLYYLTLKHKGELYSVRKLNKVYKYNFSSDGYENFGNFQFSNYSAKDDCFYFCKSDGTMYKASVKNGVTKTLDIDFNKNVEFTDLGSIKNIYERFFVIDDHTFVFYDSTMGAFRKLEKNN